MWAVTRLAVGPAELRLHMYARPMLYDYTWWFLVLIERSRPASLIKVLITHMSWYRVDEDGNAALETSGDDPETAALDEAACSVAEQASATYCTRGP
jgi:hypothetical protein